MHILGTLNIACPLFNQLADSSERVLYTRVNTKQCCFVFLSDRLSIVKVGLSGMLLYCFSVVVESVFGILRLR